MVKEFIIIYLLFLLAYYILPVISANYLLRLVGTKQLSAIKIQKNTANKKSVIREIKYSLLSLLIFSLCSTLVYQLIKNGRTNLYFSWNQFGILYFCISPIICIIFHDTYYYWLHRLMHNKYLFKYFHRVHHLSITPTAWAIYSFQPLEAFFTFLSFAITIMVIPIHPVAFGIYMLISLINNIGGHIGYEILPGWFSKHPILKYFTVVTFHDMHHTNTKFNFGAYFNVWDRLMKTIHADYENRFRRATSSRDIQENNHSIK